MEAGRFFANGGESARSERVAILQELTQARLDGDDEVIAQLDRVLATLDNISQDQPVFDVYPENIEACSLFLTLCDQWRISQAGIIGIDGNTVLSYLSIGDYTNEQRRKLYKQIQLISAGAITEWRKQHEQ